MWNGINIKIIVDQEDSNKESVNYLTIFSIIDWFISFGTPT